MYLALIISGIAYILLIGYGYGNSIAIFGLVFVYVITLVILFIISINRK